MAGDLDVVVGRDPAALPFGILVGLGRQRLQRRPLDRLEQLARGSCRRLRIDLGVELRHALADRGVQLGEREEAPVAQPRQHEALDDLHGDLHLRLVARLADRVGSTTKP